MLARLRHYALVRRDDDEGEIDAGRAGNHRSHECFVPWNIDDADRPDAVERQRRKPKFDRNAAPFFLG